MALKKTVTSVRFGDLPGWRASSLNRDSLIFNRQNDYVGFYEHRNKIIRLCRDASHTGETGECRNLHQAMRWVFLMTQKPLTQELI